MFVDTKGQSKDDFGFSYQSETFNIGAMKLKNYRTLAKSKNNHFLQIYEILQENDNLSYVICECMDKGTLKGYLERSEFFEESDSLFIFK